MVTSGCWWLLLVTGGHWWPMVAAGGHWWPMMADGGPWWSVVVRGGPWWSLVDLVVPGGHWWLLVVAGNLWRHFICGSIIAFSAPTTMWPSLSLCVSSGLTRSLVILDLAHVLSDFSHIQLFVTLRTIARQTPLSMGFSRKEPWSGLLCPPPGDLPNPGIKPASFMSLALAGGFFTTAWFLCGHEA